MRTQYQAMRVGLCGLALWAGAVVQGAAPVLTNITMVGGLPQFAVQSDLGITNQVQSCTNLTRRSRNQEFLVNRVACLNRDLSPPTRLTSNC